MSAFMKCFGRTAGTAFVTAVLCGTTPALAGLSGDPGFRMTWFASEDPGTPLTYDPATFGTREFQGGGAYRYIGDNSGSNWGVTWDVLVDNQERFIGFNPLVDGQIVVTNNADVFQTFSLLMDMPVSALPGLTLRDGSVSATVTNEFNLNEGATLRALANESIYSAFVDDPTGSGTPDHTLMDSPFELVTDAIPFDVMTATESFAGASGGGVAGNISLLLKFELSPGDSASVNGFFQVTPAPGGLALLAMAGLAGGRRRRR